MTHSELLEHVDTLIEACKDGEYGFRTCAEHARRGDLQLLLSNRADDCRLAAGELQLLVADKLRGTPGDSGSASGSVHRGWVMVKGTVTGFSDLALLEECERGEDVALDRYRAALQEDLPAVVRTVVERQYEGVKRNHLQMRSLRDGERQAQASSRA